MKVRIMMMVKNEDRLIGSWLKYHCGLVGPANITVFDNGSTTGSTLQWLQWAKNQGVNVDSVTFPTSDEFLIRGRKYVELMRAYEVVDRPDFWFLLDTDEFLAVLPSGEGGQLSLTRDSLVAELSQYLEVTHPLAIRAGLDNHPRRPGYFRWSYTQRKTFFTAGTCSGLDHGFHEGTTYSGESKVKTNIVYVHFHFKPYPLLIEHSKEKLVPFISDFSRESLQKYVDDKRSAHHCARHILRSETEYYGSFKEEEYALFTAIQDMFIAIGEPTPFLENRRDLNN